MNAIARRATACAPSGEPLTWDSIDWPQYQRTVEKLQARIVKATEEGRRGKVKALQWLLTHSLGGKALAVRRVTENKGKLTPGVDTGLYSEIQRKAETSRHPDDDGPGDAGSASARPRPGIRDDG